MQKTTRSSLWWERSKNTQRNPSLWCFHLNKTTTSIQFIQISQYCSKNSFFHFSRKQSEGTFVKRHFGLNLVFFFFFQPVSGILNLKSHCSCGSISSENVATNWHIRAEKLFLFPHNIFFNSNHIYALSCSSNDKSPAAPELCLFSFVGIPCKTETSPAWG